MARSAPTPGPNDNVVATYDRLATLYDWFLGPIASKPRTRALEVLAIDPDERILEIGCGPGHTLETLANRSEPPSRIVGLDAAPGMIDRARRHAATEERTALIDLVVGDARQLPVATDAIDVVFLEDTLELFSPIDVRTVLTECERVLNQDGRLGVVTMEREGAEEDGFVRAYEWLFEHLPGYDRVGCRPIYARRALGAAGFSITNQATIRRGYVWPVEVIIAQSGDDDDGVDTDPG